MNSALLLCLASFVGTSIPATDEKISRKNSPQTSGFFIQYTEPNLETPSETETFSFRPRDGGAFPPVTVPITDGNGPISGAGSISINGALVLPNGCVPPPPPPRQRVALMSWSETWNDGQPPLGTIHVTNHHLEIWANYRQSLKNTAETICDGFCDPATATYTRTVQSVETVAAAITGSIGIPAIGGSIGFNLAAQSGFSVSQTTGISCQAHEECEGDCSPDPVMALVYEREVQFVVRHRTENCIYGAPDDQGNQELICTPPTTSSSSTSWFVLPQNVCQACELMPCTHPCE